MFDFLVPIFDYLFLGNYSTGVLTFLAIIALILLFKRR